MNFAVKLGAVMLVLGLCLGPAFATATPAAITVTQIGCGWTVPGGTPPPCFAQVVSTNDVGTDPPLPATFVVATETETAVEPIGDFILNTTFTTPQGYYVINDRSVDRPTASDYILFGNTGPGGAAEIMFYSDATPPLPGTNNGVLCAENATGCMGTFNLSTALGDISVRAASDSELHPFDPFNVNMDYSDGIQFAAATPEPSQLPLALAMLIAVCGARRWIRA